MNPNFVQSRFQFLAFSCFLKSNPEEFLLVYGKNKNEARSHAEQYGPTNWAGKYTDIRAHRKNAWDHDEPPILVAATNDDLANDLRPFFGDTSSHE